MHPRFFPVALILAAPMAAQDSHDPAETAREAKTALAAGNFDHAAELYGQLVREMPQVAGLRLNLGIALFSAGRYGQAAAELRKARQMDPSLSPASLFLGLALARLGRRAESIAPLEAALKAEPNNTVVLLESADAYLATGHAEEVVERFRRLTHLEARNPKAWRGLGVSCAALSRAAFAKLPPDSAAALVLLARARLDEQKDATAFADFEKAIPLLEQFGFDYERGYALLELGKAGEAVPVFERVSAKRREPDVLAALFA
jgi:tetratricopeptide (TPR) repeat protein